MAYRELLDALAEDVARQTREVEASSLREASEIVAAGRARAEERVRLAAAGAQAVVDEDAARAVEHEEQEAERRTLRERRRLLDALRAEALERLSRVDDERVLARLLDELANEIGSARAVLHVTPVLAAGFSRALAARHPELRAHAEVVADAGVHGAGLVAHFDGRVLDDSLPSRLAKAWVVLEPELAASLFGGGQYDVTA